MTQIQKSARTYSQYQLDVFDHILNGSGHLVVIATAGSGKSTTIEEAIKRLVAQEPRARIQVGAFNRSIKDELGARMPQGVKVDTIHGIGYSALLRGLPMRPQSPDRGKFKYADLAQHFLAAQGVTRQRLRSEDFVEVTTAAKQLVNFAQVYCVDLTPQGVEEAALKADIDIPKAYHGVTVQAVVDTLKEGVAIAKGEGSALERYPAGEAIIAFTDMVWLPWVLDLKPAQFDYVFCDEAQDLSVAQLHLVMGACRAGGRMVFVGDPFQAIYGFAGADADSIENIVRTTKAERLPLSITYRCPASHVRLAATTGAQIEPRPGAPEGIMGEIDEGVFMREVRAGDMVLSRVTRPLVSACFQLLGMGKRAAIQGKDIGEGLVKLAKKAYKQADLGEHEFDADDLAEGLDDYVSERSAKIRAQTSRQEEADAKIEALEDQAGALRSIVDRSVARSFNALVREIEALFSDVDAADAIRLSTIHRAKGLEAERVFLIAPERLPLVSTRSTVRDIESEKFVEFVALTRAKAALYFVGSYRRYLDYLFQRKAS